MASQFTLTPEKKRRIAESKKRADEAEEDYDPKAKEAPKRTVEVKPKGTLSQYDIGNDTIRQRVASIPRSIATDVFGVNATRANRFGEDAANLVDFIPGVGDALGAAETAEAVKNRDWRGAALNAGATALGVVPVVGDIAGKGIKQLAKAGAKAETKASQFALKAEPKTMFHEISKTKLPRPLEEMTATYAGERPLKPRTTVTPEQLEGGTIIPLVGDRTIAGRELTGVNETPFETPVNLQGGPNFMRDNPDVWASDKGAVSKLINRIGETGDDVYLMHSSMGGRSGDFSKMMSDAVMEQMKNAPVGSVDRIAFDEMMRQKVPNWPGIDKVDKDWFAGSGKGRTALAQVMAQERFLKAGFPDVVSTRKALTEPELLNRPSGASGLTIARAQPGAGPVTKPEILHPTYNTNVPGEYIGGFEKPIPREIMFPEWAATRTPGESRSAADRSMLMGDIRQKADNKWLEGVMNYLRSAEGKQYGIGGAISAGLLTKEEAEELFGA